MNLPKQAANASAKVTLNRTCANCKNTWQETVHITERAEVQHVNGKEQEAREKACRKASKLVEKSSKAAEKDTDKGVCCRKCGHFSKKAMQKHFPKGFSSGISCKFRRHFNRILIKCVGFYTGAIIVLSLTAFMGLGPVFIDSLGHEFRKGDDKNVLYALILVGLIGSIYMILSGWMQTKKILAARKDRYMIADMLEGSSSDALCDLITYAYKKNGNSLNMSNAQFIDAILKKYAAKKDVKEKQRFRGFRFVQMRHLFQH